MTHGPAMFGLLIMPLLAQADAPTSNRTDMLIVGFGGVMLLVTVLDKLGYKKRGERDAHETELQADVREVVAAQDRANSSIVGINARLDSINAKVEEHNKNFTMDRITIHERIDDVDAMIRGSDHDGGVIGVTVRVEAKLDSLKETLVERLDRLEADILRTWEAGRDKDRRRANG